MPPRGSWLPSGPGQKCGLVAGRGKCNGFANTGATHLPSLFLGTWQRQRHAPGGGGGGPWQAGRPCSPALPHLPACHQLPVNQVTVLPTLPRTPPHLTPIFLCILGAQSQSCAFLGQRKVSRRTAHLWSGLRVLAQRPFPSSDPRPAGQQPQVSSREPCPHLGLRIQKGSLATPLTFSHGEAFGGQALHQGPPSLSTALGSCNSISESEVAQSCPTLCDPVDCNPPGPSVPGILQARMLEWGATSFS